MGGFICPWECQHFCHKRTLLCSRWYLAWDIIRDYRPLSPEALACFCAQTVPIKQNQLWELVSETIGLSFGSLGELLGRRLVSIAKEAQRSVSPAEWEMTCSRKPITCAVSPLHWTENYFISARGIVALLQEAWQLYRVAS